VPRQSGDAMIAVVLELPTNSDALSFWLVVSTVAVMIGAMVWLGFIRPLVRFIGRTPCSSCGLGFDKVEGTCPYCGADRDDGPSPGILRRTERRRR